MQQLRRRADAVNVDLTSNRPGEMALLSSSAQGVGAKWKALGRGNGDFRDFYPKLFKGSS